MESFPAHVFFAGTRPISHRVGRWVGPSVRPSVPLYFFGVFELFEGRIARVLVSYGCLRPCPNHFCPCPTHYCSCPTHYYPCPTARDRGSRVYGLVFFLDVTTFLLSPRHISIPGHLLRVPRGQSLTPNFAIQSTGECHGKKNDHPSVQPSLHPAIPLSSHPSIQPSIPLSLPLSIPPSIRVIQLPPKISIFI